eukprot:4239054-Alexandrium_andersonii.AAC.1
MSHFGIYQEHALAWDTGEHLGGSRPLLVSRAGLIASWSTPLVARGAGCLDGVRMVLSTYISVLESVNVLALSLRYIPRARVCAGHWGAPRS